MGEKEIFEAAKNGYAWAGELAKQLMDKHGAAMVYDALASMGEAAGRGSGEGLKQGTEKFASQLLESQLAGGWRSEVKVEGNKVVLKNHTCPCYAGYRAGGLSHEEAKMMCYSWWARFPDSAKKANRGVKNFWIEHYRSPEEDYCLEVFEVHGKS
jgi:hypothetical protein